jgi:hypothetical protein
MPQEERNEGSRMSLTFIRIEFDPAFKFLIRPSLQDEDDIAKRKWE